MTVFRMSVLGDWRIAPVLAVTALGGLAAPAQARTHILAPATPLEAWFSSHRATHPGAVPATPPALPGAPRNLVATAVDQSRIDLRWARPTDDGGERITGYRIEVSEDRRRTWSLLEEVRNTRYLHTGLPPNATRHYRVSAVNRSGTGQPSRVDWATTAATFPGRPTGLEAVAEGASRIRLSWTAPASTGGVPVFGYRIEVSENSGRSWRVLEESTRATSHTHTGLLAGSTRHYRVSAINRVGVGEPSRVVGAKTESSVPGAPTALSAQAVGTSRIDLSWTAPDHDGGERITGYRIEISANEGVSWSDEVANTNNPATRFTDVTDLEPGATRHYRVSAINSLGTGAPSMIAVARTEASVPDAPTGLQATAVDPTSINLAWTAPAYDGGDPITGYRIEASQDGAAWADRVANTGVTSTTFLDSGLEPGSTRFYRVSAINSAGAGKPSGVVAATTDDLRQRSRRVGESILPHAAAAMTSSTISAIASRVDAVASRDGERLRASLGSASSLLQGPRAGWPPGGHGPFGVGRAGAGGAGWLLDGASFVMPARSQAAARDGGIMETLSTWGGGELVGLGEPGAADIEWTGRLTNLHVGADVRPRPDVLAGVAATTSLGNFDFTDRTGANALGGTYGSRLTTVNPYAAWLLDGQGSVAWASAGYGWGSVEIEDDRAALRSTGTNIMTGAAGGSRTLLTSGTGNLRVRGEGWVARVTLDDTEDVDSLTLDMQRARLLLEFSQGYRSPGGDEIAFLVEGGMRYDGGTAVQGTGVEVGSGMRLVNAGLGMSLEARGRALLTGLEGYEEWGVGVILQIDPQIRGEGLSLRVAPAWGDASGGARELWERGVDGMRRDGADPLGGRLDAEMSYGLRGFNGTPYGGLLLADDGWRAYSGGVRYDLGGGLGLRMEVTRRESAMGPPEHAIGLRGRLNLR